MRLPRIRFTIRSLMFGVLLTSLPLAALAVRREQRGKIFALKSLEAEYQNAKLTREVAEIGVIEYLEGIYEQDDATAEAERNLAEDDLKRAIARIEASCSSLPKNTPLIGLGVSEKPTTERAVFTTETHCKKVDFQVYQRAQSLDELKSEAANARSVEQAKKAAYDRLKTPVFWPF